MDTNKIKSLLTEVKNGTKSEDDVIKEIMKDYGNSISNEQSKIQKVQEDNTKLQAQLNDANDEIKSYKDMDIDSIKKSASDWETKYNELVENQRAEKEKSIREERTNAFFNDVKFASEMAKAGVIAKFSEKDFKYDEESKTFQGAKEWLEELKKNDTNSFLSDVANPVFTTTPTTPIQNSSMDDVMKIMGLKEEK